MAVEEGKIEVEEEVVEALLSMMFRVQSDGTASTVLLTRGPITYRYR
jgi:translation initiation factor IF-1